jgi:uncharacterized membrane protein YoaK (UPF0700 family)
MLLRMETNAGKKGMAKRHPLLISVLGRDGMLLVLTWAAGCVDAISYLGLDHVFTAMMTGNTVLLGLALGQGEIRAALRSILALIGFAAGVAAGTMIAEREKGEEEWPAAVTAALIVEASLLAAFSATWHFSGTPRGAAHVLILLLSLAMGIQAAAVRRLGVPGIATTYITGTLTSLMVDLVGWMRSAAGPSPREAENDEKPVNESSEVRWERRVGLLAGVFFVYSFGALAGGILQTRFASLGCGIATDRHRACGG